MNRLFITVIILFACYNCFSQHETINRLQNKLSTAENDTSKILILDSLELYYLFFTTEQDSSLYFINQAINYAFPLSNKDYLILAYSRLALYLFATAKYKTAMEMSLKSIKLSEEYKIPYYYSNLYNVLSAIYYQLGDYKQQLKNAKLAMHYLDFARDAFLDQQSLTINNLGWAYGLNKIYDSAFCYLDKGLKLSRTSIDQTAFDGNRSFTGYTYYDLKNYTKADSILREGMEHSKQIHDYAWLENFPYALALIQLEQGKIDEAITTAHLAMNYAASIKDKKYIATSAHTLYACFEKKGVPDSALYYLKLSSQLDNEITSADINKEIQQLEFTEQLNQKEEQAKKVLEKERIRNQVSLYVFVTASAFLIIILFLQWRNNKHKQKVNLLLQQEKEKVESTLEELRSTQEQLVQHLQNELRLQQLESEKTKAELERQSMELQMKAIVATQEDERKRISRDLHDEVGTKLSAVNLFLSSLSEKAGGDEEIKLLAQSSKQVIIETITDVRQILRNLSPLVLEEYGYIAAITGLANKINETKQVHVSVEVPDAPLQLDKQKELILYRITQELINNALKHAEAKHVLLRLERREQKIVLRIEDDGKGFDINAHKDGYGLHNLDARTKLLQGSLVIDSLPGRGTCAIIEIPYRFSLHEQS